MFESKGNQITINGSIGCYTFDDITSALIKDYIRRKYTISPYSINTIKLSQGEDNIVLRVSQTQSSVVLEIIGTVYKEAYLLRDGRMMEVIDNI